MISGIVLICLKQHQRALLIGNNKCQRGGPLFTLYSFFVGYLFVGCLQVRLCMKHKGQVHFVDLCKMVINSGIYYLIIFSISSGSLKLNFFCFPINSSPTLPWNEDSARLFCPPGVFSGLELSGEGLRGSGGISGLWSSRFTARPVLL